MDGRDGSWEIFSAFGGKRLLVNLAGASEVRRQMLSAFWEKVYGSGKIEFPLEFIKGILHILGKKEG